MHDYIPDHERLREDLRRMLGEAPEPSPELRARVLELARRRPARLAPRPRWRVPAVAAILGAAAVLTLMLTRPEAPRPAAELALQSPVTKRAPEGLLRAAAGDDLNGDGRVDILDAWQLSRSLVTGPSAPPDAGSGTGAAAATDALDRLMQRIVAVSGSAS